MEEYKASSSSKSEPIMNKELLYDIEISNAKRLSLGGMASAFLQNDKLWVQVWELQKVGALCIEYNFFFVLISNAQFN